MSIRAVVLLVIACRLAPCAAAQSVVSARSGMVNFVEGMVLLDGQPVVQKRGMFTRLKDGSVLMTESGRAEILLTPDTYLRVGENSSIRLISGSLTDTRVELLAGSAIVDSGKSPAGDFVNIVFRDSTVRILKPGYYRIDADPPQLRVYEGQAEFVRDNENPITLVPSQLLPLDGAPIVRRFTDGSDGLLDLWSAERRSLISSRMVIDAQLADPLLYAGSAGLDASLGYLPYTTTPWIGMDNWGYGFYDAYPGYAVPAFGLYPFAYLTYFPRYRYPSPFPRRPVIQGGFIQGGFARGGFGFPSRTPITPRPFPPPRVAPRPLPPIRGGHGGGHR
jgi:hypothetical protein